MESLFTLPAIKTDVVLYPADKYIKAVIRGDKQADRGNPGPGQYISDVLERSVSRNSKCGSMGFTNKEIPKVGR